MHTSNIVQQGLPKQYLQFSLLGNKFYSYTGEEIKDNWLASTKLSSAVLSVAGSW